MERQSGLYLQILKHLKGKGKTMKTNMGSADRAIRLLFVAAIAILFFTDNITGITAIILGAFAVVFAFTSFTGFCPLYHPFKIRTTEKRVRG